MSKNTMSFGPDELIDHNAHCFSLNIPLIINEALASNYWDVITLFQKLMSYLQRK